MSTHWTKNYKINRDYSFVTPSRSRIVGLRPAQRPSFSGVTHVSRPDLDTPWDSLDSPHRSSRGACRGCRRFWVRRTPEDRTHLKRPGVYWSGSMSIHGGGDGGMSVAPEEEVGSTVSSVYALYAELKTDPTPDDTRH